MKTSHGYPRSASTTSICSAVTPSFCRTKSRAANSGHYAIPTNIEDDELKSNFRFRCYRTPSVKALSERMSREAR